MFTGARTHEFVLGETVDPSTIAKEYYDKDDFYTDVATIDPPSRRVCLLYNRPDDRTTAAKKVLC